MKAPRCSSLAYMAIDAPIVGRLWLAATEAGLCAIEFGGDEAVFVHTLERRWGVTPQPDGRPLAAARQQLLEYLGRQRRVFDLPLDLRLLRPFQKQVLDATLAVPWGQATTYRTLAVQVGRPHSGRAVGRAQATNPIPLIIPCHRVIGSDGSLRGYGGGLEMKAALLQLEGVTLV
jgi:methylated-DNA-[protein]-cysteine S-methyltransferase